eukprot:830324-Alexandrium_andersonii.AAC.1
MSSTSRLRRSRASKTIKQLWTQAQVIDQPQAIHLDEADCEAEPYDISNIYDADWEIVPEMVEPID